MYCTHADPQIWTGKMSKLFGSHVFPPQAKKNLPSSKSSLDPKNPFNDDERERMEVEVLAKKFESKYVSIALWF